jgi:HEAT repeat protein
VEEQITSNLRAIAVAMPDGTRAELKQQIEAVERAGGTTFQGLQRLLRDRNQSEDIRSSVSWILGRLERQEAVEDLLAASKGPSLPVRRESILSLGPLGNSNAVPGLIEIARTNGHVEERALAVHALGEIGGKEAHDELRRVLADMSEDANVRGTAAEQLGHIGGADEDVPLLIGALRDPADEVRFWSAFALGELKDPRALLELRRVAQTDQSVLAGVGSVADEAKAAVEQIEQMARTT